MDTGYKNRLQEYCQENHISLPEYLIKKESGPPHIRKFQVRVRVNHRWYDGDDLCSSKKAAEQSAAKKALECLVGTTSNSARSLPPVSPQRQSLPISRVRCDALKHFPNSYAKSEQFIANKVRRLGGRIQTIGGPDMRGRYKVEITGSYRYCENIRKQHKKSQVYFLVHPVKKIYYQKCHHRKCFGYRSPMKRMIDEQDSDVQRENEITERPLRHGKFQKRQFCKTNPRQNCNTYGQTIVCAHCYDQDDW